MTHREMHFDHKEESTQKVALLCKRKRCGGSEFSGQVEIQLKRIEMPQTSTTAGQSTFHLQSPPIVEIWEGMSSAKARLDNASKGPTVTRF